MNRVDEPAVWTGHVSQGHVRLHRVRNGFILAADRYRDGMGDEWVFSTSKQLAEFIAGWDAEYKALAAEAKK